MSFTCKVPKLRFSEFSGEWKESELQALQTKGYDITYGVLKPGEYVENGIALLQIKDIESNAINIKNMHLISYDLHTQYKRTIISENDILISVVGTIGRIAKVPASLENCNIHRNLALIKVKSSVSNDFIFHKLLSSDTQHEIAKKVIGSTQSLYNLSDLRKLKIRIPSFIEQEKIASFLSSVDAKIEQLTCKDKLLQNYKKSAMQKLFSQELRFTCNDGSEYPEWEEKKLGEIGKFNAGGDLDKLDYSKEKNEKYLYPIYANGAGEGLYGYATTFQYKKNCVTVSGRGSLGYANVRNQKFNAIVRLIVIDPKENINSKFLEETINKINFAIESTGVPQLTVPQISSYKINIPSLEEQTKIANFLSAIDEKCLHVKSQLEQTRQFKKALLQQMFV